MTSNNGSFSRRSLLAIGGLSAAGLASASLAPAPAWAASPMASGDHGGIGRALAELERASSVTIGVTAVRWGSRRAFRYRGDQRFPMCSLFKTLAAASLVRDRGYDETYWRTPIPFTSADVVVDSSILGTGEISEATPEELADAALRFSDNTAGNLLLREIGGPAGDHPVRRIARRDRDTDSTAGSPTLNEALPGDVRDTTTPDDIAGCMQRSSSTTRRVCWPRHALREWMLRNTTSNARMRAGLTPPFELADKTGGGELRRRQRRRRALARW